MDFEFYIPDRIKEGYGPNHQAFNFLKNKGCDLIITLDCGTTATDEINLISKNGVNVIIVDHHKRELVFLMLTQLLTLIKNLINLG